MDDFVSTPYNVVHNTHVDFNWEWSGQDPSVVFELKDMIGKG
jgi:hypothetical protein